MIITNKCKTNDWWMVEDCSRLFQINLFQIYLKNPWRAEEKPSVLGIRETVKGDYSIR